MRPTILLALATALWHALAAAAAPSLPGPAFPHYADAAAVSADCDRGLATAALKLRALERHAVDVRWMAASDDLNATLEDLSAPLDLVQNVHPDAAVRDAAQACTLRWQDFFSTLGQNETLYRAARKAKPADAIDREYLKTMIEGFEDNGVGLSAEQRPRAKQINDRITDLGLQFSKNVRDDATRLAFKPEDLAGVPEAVWKDAPRDAEGLVLLGLDYPVYFPVMERAERAATRERMWRARSVLGGDANLKLLGEIAQLRREYAQLFGFASYADFTLRVEWR